MDIKKMFWHLNLLFRTYKFKHIGSYCYMGKPLSLVGTQNISLGNRVRIYPGCRMETHKGGQIIIEDEKIGMRKLIARFPKFAKKFTSMINIPVFTNDELVNFARVYTKENGYKIDQMGMLALYNLIGVNQKEDQPMNIGAVKEMLDAAMAKSQGGLLKFNKKKRVDRDGFTVLYEKDFAK